MVSTPYKHTTSWPVRPGVVTVVLLLVLLMLQVTLGVVSWSLLDYVAMGILLFVACVGIELILRKIPKPIYRIAAYTLLIGIVVLIWVELSVGILGSSLRGS